MIKGKSVMGSMLKYQQLVTYQETCKKIIISSILLNKWIYKHMISELLRQLVDVISIKAVMSQLFAQNNNIINYTRKYNILIWSCDIQKLRQGHFRKKQIDAFYERHINIAKMNYKQASITKIYNSYIKHSTDIKTKYKAYQLIQYLLMTQDERIIQEFSTNSNEQINFLIKYIAEYRIYSIMGLKMKIISLQHSESSQIFINFCTFQPEDIPDNLIIRMLDNIENRLQKVSASKYFIIVRRVSDDFVYKNLITQSNKEEIETIIQQFNDNNTYDVILRSGFNLESLRKIKIRYLNYVGNKIKIDLQYPQDLITATLSNVIIINFNQCLNLKNLYSEDNIYLQHDIKNFYNLKKVYSENDKYKNPQSCLLNDLVSKNSLQYVHLCNWLGDTNIISSITLSHNIASLRYFHIEQYKGEYDIKLNVYNNFPSHLRVFNVFINSAKKQQGFKYGTIECRKNQKEVINNLLIDATKAYYSVQYPTAIRILQFAKCHAQNFLQLIYRLKTIILCICLYRVFTQVRQK